MCLIMTEDGWKSLSDAIVCVNHNDVQGIYRPCSHEHAVAETMIRANQFCEVVERGNIREIKNFDGHRLYGAFGERL